MIITEPILFFLTLLILIGTVVNVLSVTTAGRLLQTSTVLLTTGLDTVIRVRIGYLYECLAGFPDDCSKQVVEIHCAYSVNFTAYLILVTQFHC